MNELRPKFRINADTGCWEWQRAQMRGYGNHGRLGLAHRVYYRRYVGPIPEGHDIDHLCRVRLCVNPMHLEAVTRRENNLRGIGFAGSEARQTHCRHGHPFDAQNTAYRRDRLGRVCRACRAATNTRLAQRYKGLGIQPVRYALRRRVFELRGTTCHWCGTDGARTVDHLVPLREGGSNELANLVVACQSCNSAHAGRERWGKAA